MKRATHTNLTRKSLGPLCFAGYLYREKVNVLWESPQATHRSRELPLVTCLGSVAGGVGGHGRLVACLFKLILMESGSKLK